MCLLEVRKQPFPVGGGSKKFGDWGEGGLKIFRTLGGGVTFAGGGGSVPHYMPW